MQPGSEITPRITAFQAGTQRAAHVATALRNRREQVNLPPYTFCKRI
jgi:hypothetical protein